MKKNLKFLAMAVVSMAAAVFTGCSSDDDFLASYEESAIQTRATPNYNPQIEMFARFKMKSSFHKTKRII